MIYPALKKLTNSLKKKEEEEEAYNFNEQHNAIFSEAIPEQNN